MPCCRFARRWMLAVLGLAALAGRASAEPRHYDDATLHAIQFVDEQEGWAVGDDGVIWHTIDGGQQWERQPSGVRASLRGLHFLNPYTGWIVGRQELPGGGSAGVLLYTTDGGVKWRNLLTNALPGLHAVQFLDAKVGYLVGDGSDGYPTGAFQTTDGGRNWQPIAGPRAPGWRALAVNEEGASLAGAWNRLATVRKDRLHLADVDALGGRSVLGLHLADKRGVAVGQGGLVLATEAGGASWGFVELPLTPAQRAACDFHAVHGVGPQRWIVGRPGSFLLHSDDAGKTWKLRTTGQSAPLHGVHFRDERRGWAVGALGTILDTRDGGQTWTVRKRGGERAAVLFAHAHDRETPFDLATIVGAEEGYLAAAVRIGSADPASAEPKHAGDPARFAAAFRAAGGTAGESLWQFPLPAHLTRGERAALLRHWDRLHDDHAADQLLGQLVLALRMWRPEVVITDGLNEQGVIGEAMVEAVRRAGDPAQFADQCSVLGLKPWKPAKVYGVVTNAAGASVTLDLTAVRTLLEATAAEYASEAAGLYRVTLPGQRHVRLIGGHLADAAQHRHIMQGIDLPHGGLARRPLRPVGENAEAVLKAIRQRANLEAMARAPADGLAGPERVLAQLGPMLSEMPDEQAARAAHGIASRLARTGQWVLAREAYLFLVDRYPTHPLAAEGQRWLLMHNSSSEARRRHELGQFLIATRTSLGAPGPNALLTPGSGGPPPTEKTETEIRQTRMVQVLTSHGDVRKWYEGALAFEPKLAGFGPLFANDPALQFCLQAARRNLGDFEGAKEWYQQFVARQPEGPWRSAALAELWLVNRSGPPPKPVAFCRHAAERPHLDGRLDDACWQGGTAVRLGQAAGDSLADSPAEVRLAYDREFLYVAVKCSHPAGQRVEPVKGRKRDMDLRGHDRVSFRFDLDRDYATAFHFQIDQRGCTAEDCWGDSNWNPRWFVAVHSEETCWTAEAAIPLTALTGDTPTAGRAWAFNAVRVVPNRGVQAFSLPAEAPEEAPRPEGMGLLTFVHELPKAMPKSP